MNKEIILKELSFKAVRSSGAGGQSVNKVSSKVMLSFDVANSEGLTDREKARLYKGLSSKLTNESVLILSCKESKSQHQNKTIVIRRFFALIEAVLVVRKRRVKSKASLASVKRMKEKKKRRGELKKSRKKPRLD